MAGRTITPIKIAPALAHPAAAGGRRKFYFTRADDRARSQDRDHGLFERLLALSAFTVLLFFYVALPSLKLAGMPLRGLLSLVLLSFLLLARPSVAATAMRKYLPLIGLAGGFALLGLFVSLANRTPFDVIVTTLLEVHLQLVVLTMVAAMLAEICGARLCMWAIVAVIGGSAAFALLQMLGFDFAWDVRKSLGPLARDELRPATIEWRPTGLSYSPIQLSTQLCLAFGAFMGVRHAERLRIAGNRSADPAVIFALLVLIAGSIAAATRSPILGGIIFLVAYVMLRRQTWLAVVVALSALLIYLAWPLLAGFIESEAPRILRTDDKSAAARSVFAWYGIRLFVDNPVGYGFGFHPAELWAPYWPELYMMRGSRGTQENMLHNYVLSMINIYGVGILLLAPLAIKLLMRASVYLIFFIPYAVHILFHNSGPYYSDTIIWFVIAAIGAAAAQTGQGFGRAHRLPPRRARLEPVRQAQFGRL
ncbi:MAG: O-antigen ligase family protein [Pseudomonadota bacterium]|nr:O-antigen ligase family protein [Pseudomonadota bacterium]